MIVLHETGLLDHVQCERSVVAYAAKPNEDVLKDNPLGKIPTLVLDDGTSLIDSPVICEYLDTLHAGPRLLPESGETRFRELRWQALGDGMTDILLLWRNEQMRPDGSYEVVTAAFDRKVRACFAQLEREADMLSSSAFGLGQIAIICAIGQLDFRFPNSHWHKAHPKLAAWYARVSERPSIAATVPEDDASSAATRPDFDNSVSPINFLGVQE